MVNETMHQKGKGKTGNSTIQLVSQMPMGCKYW